MKLWCTIYFLACVASLQAQQIVLNAHSMVYHEKDQAIYVFGGATDKEVSNTLYELTEKGLERLKSNEGPEARTFAGMAYNSNDHSILLFGGSKVLFGKGANPNNLLNDTWKLKDGNWQETRSSNTPTARAEGALAFDAKRNRFVLFGGYTIEEGKYIPLNDTWEFYDENWHLAAETGPSARHGASLWYDADKENITLFGGSTKDRSYGPKTGETWQWDGSKWHKMEMDQPPNVFNSNVAINTSTHEALRFGGWTGKGRTNETWLFSENTWQVLNPPNSMPPARNHSQMIYDSANDRFILFGGHDGRNVFGDIWAYKDKKWELLLVAGPKVRIRNGH